MEAASTVLRGRLLETRQLSRRKDRVPAADAYQMLAYCTAYGLRYGHIVRWGGAGE